MDQAPDVLDRERLRHTLTGREPFSAAIRSAQMAMVVTDPNLPDNPIVFVNDAFLRMTGYDRAEVLGRNCRFLQGPDTAKVSLKCLSDGLRKRRPVSVDLLNYRKDGQPFWNGLHISPVFGEDGRLDYFFGAQLDITPRMARQQEDKLWEAAQFQRNADLQKALDTHKLLLREVDHRMKNSLQMVSATLMLQALSIPDPKVQQTLREMLERVDAVGLAHKRLYEKGQADRFDLADFLRELASDVVAASGCANIALDLRLQPVAIGAEAAAALALVLNEALTNAVKHGFKAGRMGTLGVTLDVVDEVVSIGIADDGPGLPADGPERFGSTLIRTLTDQLHATLDWRSTHPGTLFRLSFPLDPSEAAAPPAGF